MATDTATEPQKPRRSRRIEDYFAAAACPRPEMIEGEELRRDYRLFIRAAWPRVDPATFTPGWHVDCIAEHLQAVFEGQIRRLLINMPPACMKSKNVGVLWPAWCMANDPAIKLMYASFEESLANRDSIACRDLIRTRWFRSRWPHVQTQEAKDTIKRFGTTRGGHRIATTPSATGGLGDHADIQVADDPQSNKKIYSKLYQRETIRWWQTTWANRLLNRETGRRVVCMQRLHEADLSGHILRHETGWVHLMLPQEYEPRRCFYSPLEQKPPLPDVAGEVVMEEHPPAVVMEDPLPAPPAPRLWQDPRQEEGELLWPAHLPREEVDKIKTEEMGPVEFATQHQQNVSPPGGILFLSEHWRYYTPDMLPNFSTGLISVDMNFGDTITADPDYVAASAWARFEATFWLLDEIRGRWEYAEARQLIWGFWKACSSKWRVTKDRLLIEKAANGPALISDMKKVVPGTTPFEARKYGNKEQRARAVVPIQQAHQIMIPEPNAARGTLWVNAWKGEHETFPNSEHDDRVDSTTQALLVLREKTGNPFWIGK